MCLAVVKEAAEISVQLVGVTSVGKPVVFTTRSIKIARSPTEAPEGIVIVAAVEIAFATNDQVAAFTEPSNVVR